MAIMWEQSFVAHSVDTIQYNRTLLARKREICVYIVRVKVNKNSIVIKKKKKKNKYIKNEHLNFYQHK